VFYFAFIYVVVNVRLLGLNSVWMNVLRMFEEQKTPAGRIECESL